MNLRDDYEHPLEKRMAEAAFIVAVEDDGYDTPAEALFGLLVRGTAIYIQAWAEAHQGSASQLIVDADDLEDPSRIEDPNATARTLLDLLLGDALDYNVRYILFGDTE